MKKNTEKALWTLALLGGMVGSGFITWQHASKEPPLVQNPAPEHYIAKHSWSEDGYIVELDPHVRVDKDHGIINTIDISEQEGIGYKLGIHYVPHKHSALGHVRDANRYELHCYAGTLRGRVIIDDMRQCDNEEITRALGLVNSVRKREGLQPLVRGIELNRLSGQEGTYKLEKID